MPPQLTAPQHQLSSRAGRYFAALVDAYDRAAQRSDERVFDLAIGRWGLRAHFASSVLADRLLPALARLLGATQLKPESLIYLWDTASTQAHVPPFPWKPADVLPQGSVSGYNDARFRTLYRQYDGGCYSLTMFDRERRVAYVWFAAHERISWIERAEPLRAAIHSCLTTDHRFLAHASAVGDQRGGVMLTGKGGAGKTTTALASIAAGLQFVGDNYVLVSLEDQPEVHGLYGTAKLWPETLSRLPELAPYVDTFDITADEKLVVDVMRYRPDCLMARLPVRALVIPVLADRSVARLERCSPVDALLALAPGTLLWLPRTDRGLDGMPELVRAVPTYRLELGEDVMSGPAALSALLDELG